MYPLILFQCKNNNEMVIIMKEILFKVKYFPFGCLLWKGCFFLCCFTNIHDQIIFDEQPQIRMQLASRFCAVCARRRCVRFCFITELAAPAADHKPLSGRAETPLDVGVSRAPKAPRIPAGRSGRRGRAGDAHREVAAFHRSAEPGRGENNPLAQPRCPAREKISRF